MAMSPFLYLLGCLSLISALYPPIASSRMTSRGLHRRHQETPPTINTTVHDQTGKDISSSFRTMIFHHHRLPNTTFPTNLTDKRRSLLSARQDPNDWDRDYSEPHLMFRTIVGCEKVDDNQKWHFQRSECDHSRSTQAYTVWCRPYTKTGKRPDARLHYLPPQPQPGTCAKHETCINGPDRDNQGKVSVAWCIDRDAFVELARDALGGGAEPDPGRGREGTGGGAGSSQQQGQQGQQQQGQQQQGQQQQGQQQQGQQQQGQQQRQQGALSTSGTKDVGGSGVTSFQVQSQVDDGTSLGEKGTAADGSAVEELQLGGMTMSAVASKADGISPLNMQTLDVEAGVLGGAGDGLLVGADGTAVQEKSCENCVDLEMGQFKEGTAALRTEATVLTAAGAATGVLWLALFA